MKAVLGVVGEAISEMPVDPRSDLGLVRTLSHGKELHAHHFHPHNVFALDLGLKPRQPISYTCSHNGLRMPLHPSYVSSVMPEGGIRSSFCIYLAFSWWFSRLLRVWFSDTAVATTAVPPDGAQAIRGPPSQRERRGQRDLDRGVRASYGQLCFRRQRDGSFMICLQHSVPVQAPPAQAQFLSFLGVTVVLLLCQLFFCCGVRHLNQSRAKPMLIANGHHWATLSL